MKALVVASTLGMAREDWLELRRKGIGGSDIGAVCGVNPYRSAYEVWVDKIGMAGSEQENPHMEWGNRLEEVVTQKFADEHPEWKVCRLDKMLRHPDHEYALANIDRLLTGKGGSEAILEVKTSRYGVGYTERTVPDSVMLQVQWYLGITGLAKGYVAVLIGGQDYREYEVEFDSSLFERMVEIAADFWQKVQDGTAPPADGSTNTADLLAKQFPQTSDESVELPPQALELASKYCEAKAAIKHYDYIANEAANQLKQYLKEHSSGVVGDYNISWKEQKRRTVSPKSLQAAHPDIYDELATESVFRVFSVKKAGEIE